ncbi:MAG: hypothetical protein WA162_01040 [Thermodesulfobacteriota bacterium]
MRTIIQKALLVLFGVFFVAGLASSAIAEDEDTDSKTRVVEEEIVLFDPTVAAKKKWVIGGSYDYWKVKGEYSQNDSYGDAYATGKIDGSNAGGSVWIGYDVLTLAYTTRSGSWDIDSTLDVSYTTPPTPGVEYLVEQDQKEDEVTLRVLIPGKTASLYFLAGVSVIKIEETNTLTTPGWTWNSTGTPERTSESTYTNGLLGVGLILPFNKYVGVRGDIRGMFGSVDYEDGVGYTTNVSCGGLAGTGTFYVNIYKGLNVQGGVKAMSLGCEDAWLDYSRVGTFASAGYSYKF